jgi:predicted amidophosphoribosyltransferase
MNTDTVRDWAESTLEFIYPPICLGCGAFRDSSQMFCDRCSQIISYLEHPICINCRGPIETGIKCPVCRPGLPLFALGDHIGPLREAVIGLKFRHVRRVAHWAGQELIARQKKRILELSTLALVPVPLHPRREYFRGFNQAELIAESLADDLNVDIRCDLVVRKKHRKIQSRLTNDVKLKYLRRVFMVLLAVERFVMDLNAINVIVGYNLVIRSKYRKMLRHLSGDMRVKNVHGVFKALPVEETVGGILIVDDVVTSGATVTELSRVLSEAGHRVVGVVAIAHRG